MVLRGKAALRRSGRGIAIGLEMNAIPLHAVYLGSSPAWQTLGKGRKAGLGHLRFSTDWFLASGTIGSGPVPVTWDPYRYFIVT